MEHEFVARQRFVRISPRKMKYVVDLIRGKNVEDAIQILRFCPKRGAYYALKLIKSAMANAVYVSGEKKYKVDFKRLHLVKADVSPGPVFKRTRPSSMRRPTLIRKRTSHLTFVLKEVASPEVVRR